MVETKKTVGNTGKTQDELNKDAKKAAKGCGLGCLGIILVAVLLTVLLSFCEGDRTVDKYNADVFAEDFVKEKLKSPSSAKFASTSEKTIKEVETNVWEVSGWVDSENSFGASIRSNFKVKMEYDPEEESWTLKDISID